MRSAIERIWRSGSRDRVPFFRALSCILIGAVCFVVLVTESLLAEPSFADEDSIEYKWIGNERSNASRILFLRNKRGKVFEYRELADQEVYGYDTFQGSCKAGKYRYHVLWNRLNNMSRIIKVNHSTNKVEKVSKEYYMAHANDMTYNTKRGVIAIIHGDGDLKGISVFNPKTLKRTKIVEIEIPSKLKGASKKYTASIKGVTGIGYDRKNNRYIASIKGGDDYMTLSPDFVPTSVIQTDSNGTEFVRQGMDVKEGFILRAFSPGSSQYNYNKVVIYDPEGKYVKRVKLGGGYEIESIFFNGKKMYASTYKSYWETVTVKKKVKVKVKTDSGKTRYKYKKKKVKVEELRRDNNVIRIFKY